MTVEGETPRLQPGRLGASGEIEPDTYAQDTAAATVPVESIRVGDRFRKELGDVSELAASIAEIGLLNPLTVTPAEDGGLLLVAGERRLVAVKALGWSHVPVRVASNNVEAADLLAAERDENTQRKPMLPSELAALGMVIERMEKPAAQERRLEGNRRGSALTNGTALGGHVTTERMKSRDIAAGAVGMSESSYRRVKQAIMTAAAILGLRDDIVAEALLMPGTRVSAKAAADAVEARRPVAHRRAPWWRRLFRGAR